MIPFFSDESASRHCSSHMPTIHLLPEEPDLCTAFLEAHSMRGRQTRVFPSQN